MMNSRTAVGLALMATLLCPACLRVSWGRTEFNQPLAESSHLDLVAGDTDLTQCLSMLGAPLYAWEEGTGNLGLAWAWNHELDWGANLSIPLAQEFSATLDYQDAQRSLNGLALVFDDENRLVQKRLGLLSELAVRTGRRRPSVVPEDEP